MENLIKEKVKKLLKSNGNEWIAEDEIARKINRPFLEVDRILEELKRDDLVESRIAR